MNKHRMGTVLAHTVGAAAITIGVEANSTDTDVMTRAEPGRGSATVGAQPGDCGRVRSRDGAQRSHPARDDTLDMSRQACFADILQALAEGMRPDEPLARLADRASSGNAGVSVPASTTFATDVDIPDTGLRDAIAAALGKQPGDPITDEDMATLTSLSAADRGIRDLTGLRHANGLRKLHLDWNAIVDISELGALSALTDLSLAGNAVADVAPLARLGRLRSLSLARNGLVAVDLDPLVAMRSLEILDLVGNELTHTGLLGLLTGLRDLRLDDNRISNVHGLEDLQNLRTLTLDGNQIEDAVPLAALPELRTLSLVDNRIANIWWLGGFAQIERLSLRGNQIADIGPLSGLSKLAQLGLGLNELADISPLAALDGLVLLDLEGNRIVDINPLAGLTGLVGLGLGHNDIVDAAALASLVELAALDLGGNALEAVPSLAGLKDLKTLWLNANEISDIGGLAGREGLNALHLADNDISDIAPLANLDGLTTLDLGGNAIDDLGSLAGLDKLERLWLTSNMLSDLSPLSGLNGLTALSVSGNEVDDISALAGIESLRQLWLHNNRIADLAALAGLKGLEFLAVQFNAVTDVSPLAGLAELHFLHLSGNDIRDLSPLAGLPKLAKLYLSDNRIADVAPLSGLRDMRVLVLSNNDISEIGDVGRLKNLWVLDVDNNDIADIAPLVDNPGMGRGDIVDLRQNPLSGQALEDVDVLRGRGVLVAVDGPDLVAESASVSEAELAPDASFTLSATVRNAGADAAATTLRYYRSGDADISAADTEVGTDAVAGLAAGAESAESISLTAPSAAGTYYYGACVDTVPGEADTANNCSDGVAVEVSDSGGGTGDDHGDTFASATSVAVPSTSDGELEKGGDKDYFRFDVASAGTLTVGTAGSTDTYGTLFDSNETSLESDDDDGPGRNFEIDRDVTAGTYFVEVRGFSTSTTGTYELEVAFVSSGGGGATPDLVTESVAVSDVNPDPGAAFTLDATVRNAGDGDAAATTLRYYRSDDAAISTGDTEVATDAVAALAAGASSAESISLTAPSSAGTYYYGACVDTVSGESDTANNCSDGVGVEVSGAGGATDDHGDTIGLATAVSSESSTGGDLEGDGDLDYFRLEIGSTTTLTVWTSGGTDTYGTLFDADGGSLDTNDDGGSGTNFEIERELQAGTYFVEVRGFRASTTGSYRLNASTMHGGLAVHPLSCSDIPAGVVLGHGSERAALDAAIDACEDDGGTASECSSRSTAFRRCGAIVYGESGNQCIVTRYSIFASTRSEAEDVALDDCRSDGNSGCRILTDDSGERMSGCNSQGDGLSGPDLVVESPSVDDATPDAGGSLTLSVTVSNRGTADALATTLRYYRSSDSTISSTDTEVGTDSVGGLAAGADGDESISLTAPSSAGTYYYGACVDSVSGESNTANNCSTGVRVDVGGSGGTVPDLVVVSPSVDDDTPDAGDTITFSTTVRNRGDGTSAATTLRYYRSSNATISSSDTAVGTDAVGGLAAGASGAESISLTVPSDAGTYYYGACVDSVSGESNTANNCSDGVEVEVSDGGGGTDSYCRDDDTVDAGDSCDIYNTNHTFEVSSSGRACVSGFCSSGSLSIRSGSWTLVGSRNSDDSWTIDDVEPEPD